MAEYEEQRIVEHNFFEEQKRVFENRELDKLEKKFKEFKLGQTKIEER
jgi:hypothetical protein